MRIDGRMVPTLVAQVGPLAIGILLLGATQEQERVVIATNVVCRAEAGSSAVPVASLDLSERLRVRESVRLDSDSGPWLLVDSARRYGPCWVYGPLTAPFDRRRPEDALLVIADRMLATQADRTLVELVQAENLLLQPPFGVDVDASAALSLRRLQIVAAALSRIDSWGVVRQPLVHAWVLAHRGEIVYNEPGGVWYVDRSRYWHLYERFRDTPWADEIAWTAASSRRGGECEGHPDCYLSWILDGAASYWEVFPQGRFVADALMKARRRAAEVTALCREGRAGSVVSDSILMDLRMSLAHVVSEEKEPLLSELEQIESRCSDGSLPSRGRPR